MRRDFCLAEMNTHAKVQKNINNMLLKEEKNATNPGWGIANQGCNMEVSGRGKFFLATTRKSLVLGDDRH